MLEGAWMGILLGGRGGCEAPPLLLLSLSLVVGRGRGSCASQEELVTPCPLFEGMSQSAAHGVAGKGDLAS